MPPFPVLYYDEHVGEVREWFWTTREMTTRLAMRTPAERAMMRQEAGNEIVAWTRALAATRRAWQVLERRFREWKGAQYVAAKTKTDATKPPSDAAIEAAYRTRPEYQTLSAAVERAEEATSSLEGIVNALTIS